MGVAFSRERFFGARWLVGYRHFQTKFAVKLGVIYHLGNEYSTRARTYPSTLVVWDIIGAGSCDGPLWFRACKVPTLLGR